LGPIVINGVIYSISSGDKVAALDGKTGQQVWSYKPKLDPLTKKALFAPYSRGVAVGQGMVFIGTVEERGIALDQKIGKEKWLVQLTDFANCRGCNFRSAPVVAGDILTFGSTAGELATAAAGRLGPQAHVAPRCAGYSITRVVAHSLESSQVSFRQMA
jgi:alcohol dehydrogenase (cytochrome c)